MGKTVLDAIIIEQFQDLERMNKRYTRRKGEDLCHELFNKAADELSILDKHDLINYLDTIRKEQDNGKT